MFTGIIHLLKIGLDKRYYRDSPTCFETIDQKTISGIYRPRNPFAHKYNFGHALLYAGSRNMMGAAVLCSKAVLKSGAGLVTIHVPQGAEPIIHTTVPEAITISSDEFIKSLIKKTALAAGPGLEHLPKNKQLIIKLLGTLHIPLVLDATALSLLISHTRLLPLRKTHPVILTPHTGEFDKLFGQSNNDFERLKLAALKATTLNCYIILKGHHTLIACPDGTNYFNTTGNAGMATAGSGDTLTGILCGLLAQGYPEKEASILGVYLHGLAGDLAADQLSQESMIATDIIEHLGGAFKAIKRSCFTGSR